MQLSVHIDLALRDVPGQVRDGVSDICKRRTHSTEFAALSRSRAHRKPTALPGRGPAGLLLSGARNILSGLCYMAVTGQMGLLSTLNVAHETEELISNFVLL